MSVRRLEPGQADAFVFSSENLAWAQATIKKYPEGRQASATLPLLWRAQEQHGGWLPRAAMEYVGELLGVPFMRIYEVATFYTMFQLSPVGKKAHVQVCGTTPCLLRGSDGLKEVCRKTIAHEPHVLSPEGDFSWEEVECLGACVNAPLVQIGSKTYEDLTPEALEGLLEALKRGEEPKVGPQNGRWLSAPQGRPTTLIEGGIFELTRGSVVPEEMVGFAPPPALGAPRGGMPDLFQKISDLTTEWAEKLYGLGIYHYDQIARWTTAEALWIDRYLEAGGRVLKDDWMGQALALSQRIGEER